MGTEQEINNFVRNQTNPSIPELHNGLFQNKQPTHPELQNPPRPSAPDPPLNDSGLSHLILDRMSRQESMMQQYQAFYQQQQMQQQQINENILNQLLNLQQQPQHSNRGSPTPSHLSSPDNPSPYWEENRLTTSLMGNRSQSPGPEPIIENNPPNIRQMQEHDLIETTSEHREREKAMQHQAQQEAEAKRQHELKIREQAVRQAQAKENESAQKRMEHQRKKDEHRIEKREIEALKAQYKLLQEQAKTSSATQNGQPKPKTSQKSRNANRGKGGEPDPSDSSGDDTDKEGNDGRDNDRRRNPNRNGGKKPNKNNQDGNDSHHESDDQSEDKIELTNKERQKLNMLEKKIRKLHRNRPILAHTEEGSGIYKTSDTIENKLKGIGETQFQNLDAINHVDLEANTNMAITQLIWQAAIGKHSSAPMKQIKDVSQAVTGTAATLRRIGRITNFDKKTNSEMDKIRNKPV